MCERLSLCRRALPYASGMVSSSQSGRLEVVLAVAVVVLIAALGGCGHSDSGDRAGERDEPVTTPQGEPGEASGSPRRETPRETPGKAPIVRPGRSIGRVELGDSLEGARRRLGRERYGGARGLQVWFVNGGALSVRFRAGRAVSIYTNSSRYRLNGVTLGDDFEDVVRALPGWKVAPCGDDGDEGGVLSRKNPRTGASTWIQILGGEEGPGGAVIVQERGEPRPTFTCED